MRNGRYSVPVAAGSYTLYFFPGPGVPFVGEWWDDQASFEAADPVDATSSVSGIDAELAPGVLISGRVTSSGGGLPLQGATVHLYDGSSPCWVFLDNRGTAVDGDGGESIEVLKLIASGG